jgi:hypothetical protein
MRLLLFALLGAASASADIEEFLRPANESEILASLHAVSGGVDRGWSPLSGGGSSRRHILQETGEHVVNPDFANVHKELLKLKPSETAAKDLDSHVAGAAEVIYF